LVGRGFAGEALFQRVDNRFIFDARAISSIMIASPARIAEKRPELSAPSAYPPCLPVGRAPATP
jgi:hypothetical protein